MFVHFPCKFSLSICHFTSALLHGFVLSSPPIPSFLILASPFLNCSTIKHTKAAKKVKISGNFFQGCRDAHLSLPLCTFFWENSQFNSILISTSNGVFPISAKCDLNQQKMPANIFPALSDAIN